MYANRARVFAKKVLTNAYKNKANYAKGVAAFGVYSMLQSAVQANDHPLTPPAQPWEHSPNLKTFDHRALRRGYEVYRQVCSTCHSMDLVNFRNLVGVTHTEEQAQALAATYEIQDGPNDTGEMYDRPRKLFDPLPRPYANEEQARFINGGALPPDLSLITKARDDGENYVFSLLTGYTDAPAGVHMNPGMHYNPYFPGSQISMAPPINMYGQVDYEDDTPPTVTQMAKDVTCFLAWCAEPEHDERKYMGVNACVLMVLASALAGYHKRFRFASMKTAKFSTIHVPPPRPKF